MTTTAAVRTGIKSADELIADAIEYGLDVEIDENEYASETTYGIRVTLPCPKAFKDSVLGLEIRSERLYVVYARSSRPGSRGAYRLGDWRNLHRDEKVSGPKAARVRIASMGRDVARTAALLAVEEQQQAPQAPEAPSEALRAVVDDITREEDAAAVSELYAAHREAEEQRAGEGVWVVLPEALPGTAVQGPYRVPARAVALHTEASGWGGQYRTYRVEVTEDVPRIGEAAQVEYRAGEVLTVEAAFFDAAPQGAVSAAQGAGERREAEEQRGVRESVVTTVPGGYRVRIAVEQCENAAPHDVHVYAAAANRFDRSGHYAQCNGVAAPQGVEGRALVGRWESDGGRYWVELYRDAYGYGYDGKGCGGSLGKVTEAEALRWVEERTAGGAAFFHSGSRAMRRTVPAQAPQEAVSAPQGAGERREVSQVAGEAGERQEGGEGDPMMHAHGLAEHLVSDHGYDYSELGGMHNWPVEAQREFHAQAHGVAQPGEREGRTLHTHAGLVPAAPQEAPARVRLQGVGWVPAVEASDLVVGDRVMWNFGLTSEVLAIKDVSPAFLVITHRYRDGKVFERRMKKSGRSVARVGTFLAGV